MPMKEIILTSGLRFTREDPRDFQFHKVFGALSPLELPMGDFDVNEPVFIENQGSSDICPSEMATALAEAFYGIDFEPTYTFAKTKQIEGDWQSWGADPNDALKSGVDFGFLPKDKSPFTLENGRNFIANPDNWPKELDAIAAAYKMGSFYNVRGPHDFFDNVRSALYINYQSRVKSPVGTGAYFYGGWLHADGGIVPTTQPPESQLVPHAFIFFGQRIIDGVPYLKAQLSSGKEAGDDGVLYFSRDTVNKLCLFAKCYREIAKSQAKILNTNNLTVEWLWLAKLIGKLFN